jgi:hypothetical protein
LEWNIKSSYQQSSCQVSRVITQFTYQHNEHMFPFGFHEEYSFTPPTRWCFLSWRLSLEILGFSSIFLVLVKGFICI